MCFQSRWTCLPLAIVDLSLWWQAPCKAFQVLADILPQHLACNLLRLKSFPWKRYLIGIPLSPSLKASVSMAENIILNSVEASTQPCLTPFVTRNGSENSLSFWTLASIPAWNWRIIAMNLAGQPNFAKFQSPSRLTVSNALVRSTNVM